MTETELLKKQIAALLEPGSVDELRAFETLARRVMGKGRIAYGPTDLANDKRNYRGEALDECWDACWYFALDHVRMRDRVDRFAFDTPDVFEDADTGEHLRQGGEILNAPGTKPGGGRPSVVGGSPTPDTDDDTNHPWYGPCDGFREDRCGVCADLATGVLRATALQQMEPATVANSPLGDALQTATVVPDLSERAAIFICPDCTGRNGIHALDCPYVVVVPGKEQSA